MRTLGNILWHIPFLGFLSALAVFLLGSLLVLTVVAAPIGLGLIQLSKFLLAPFSSAMGNDLSKNNSIGFPDLPGGQRSYDGTFINIKYFGNW